MKRLMIAAAVVLMLTGCGDTSKVDGLIDKANSEKEQVVQSSADDSSKESEKATDDIAADYWADRETTPVPQTTLIDESELVNGDIDIDLTALNANMLYAQVFEMTGDPEKYQGKTVRAKGTFAYYEGSDNDDEIFAVFIADAAACCAQGLEFRRDGEYSYPEDYPEINAPITVTGTFNSYKIGVFTYCELADAVLETE